MSIGNCPCDNRNQHAACDEGYLDAPLYAPSKTQLDAERTAHMLAGVESIIARLERSNQCEDREIAEDLRNAIGATK